ncbi:MAG: cytochrome c [Chitinophagales bacterium]|nr:cytochrome c [Chitinophagales bacterium]
MKKILIIPILAILFTIACKSPSSEDFSSKDNAAEEATTEETATTSSKDAKMLAGVAVYKKTCFACHQAEGQGVENAFPPLAKSDYLNADVDRAIKGIIHGQSGEMVVNGKTYNSAMPPQDLSDEEIANVLTYVLNNWENSGGDITAEQVSKLR